MQFVLKEGRSCIGNRQCFYDILSEMLQETSEWIVYILRNCHIKEIRTLDGMKGKFLEQMKDK